MNSPRTVIDSLAYSTEDKENMDPFLGQRRPHVVKFKTNSQKSPLTEIPQLRLAKDVSLKLR